MDKTKVDYSLYLVTDSTEAILRGRDLVQIVQEAVEGGVGIVQYRDKVSDTADLIRTGKALHSITQKHNVPLLVNDRIDVALAVGCEGVHIGQDDMDLETARRILGEKAIIGVTVQSKEEAAKANQGGADYLGIGTVFATPTKENTKSIIGTAGVRDILASLAPSPIRTVCIGGINASNIQRVLYQSTSSKKELDGVAVVSAIVGAEDPQKASQKLVDLIKTPPAFVPRNLGPSSLPEIDLDLLKREAPRILKKITEVTPLCHNMTNMVVQNIAANVALAIGASPIMSNNPLEASDLAALQGSLVINMGTTSPESQSAYVTALRAYNAVGGPVVYDPVGAGATQVRRDAVKTLMAGGYFDLIKGNENEICTVSGTSGVQQKGVDSGVSTLSLEEKGRLVAQLAERERNVILMTGKVDVISDGRRTYAIENGHAYLGMITGSGCTLGTTIAGFLAIEREDKLLAAVVAILLFEIASEFAGVREDVRGPGTFVPAFLDELYRLRTSGAASWIERAKVRKL